MGGLGSGGGGRGRGSDRGYWDRGLAFVKLLVLGVGIQIEAVGIEALDFVLCCLLVASRRMSSYTGNTI